MANKQTIQGVDARMRDLIIRIASDAKELNDLRAKRKKMVAGKIKVPPPPGKKVLLNIAPAEFQDRADDLWPVAPGSSGPC